MVETKGKTAKKKAYNSNATGKALKQKATIQKAVKTKTAAPIAAMMMVVKCFYLKKVVMGYSELDKANNKVVFWRCLMIKKRLS